LEDWAAGGVHKTMWLAKVAALVPLAKLARRCTGRWPRGTAMSLTALPLRDGLGTTCLRGWTRWPTRKMAQRGAASGKTAERLLDVVCGFRNIQMIRERLA
jgi:hypothetical protein